MGETIRMDKISNPTLRKKRFVYFYVDVFKGGGKIYIFNDVLMFSFFGSLSTRQLRSDW